MSPPQKTAVSIAVFIIIFLVFIVFTIGPLLDEIEKGSQDVLAQKNALAETETEAKNLQEYKTASISYEQNLAKLDTLFVNLAEPVNFIEFLEKTANQLHLSVEISSLIKADEKRTPWPSMNFQLMLAGSFPNILKFIEKMELSPFLVEASALNMRRLNSWDVSGGKYKGLSVGDISASFPIKVYTR